MFIYWQFVTLSIGQTVFNAGRNDPDYQQAVAGPGW